MAGVFVKRLLNIDYIVYYIFDWSIKWFNNIFLDYIYVWFDKYACYHSDFIWNITDRIAEERIKNLKYNGRRMGKQLTVPYGIPFREKLVRNESDPVLDTIVYSGYLSYENGALLLPEIAREVERTDKNIKIMIIGGGEEFETVKEKIVEYNLENVRLYGHISDQDEIDRLLVKAHVAIAPYIDIPYSKKRYGDVIKIRNYFACGLPVISTNVVPVSEEIIAEKLGFVVTDSAKEFARACIELLKNRHPYQEIRSNIMKKAINHNWDNIFSEALEKMFQ